MATGRIVERRPLRRDAGSSSSVLCSSCVSDRATDAMGPLLEKHRFEKLATCTRTADLATEFRRGLDGLSENETRNRLVRIERLITEWSKGRKLYGHLYDDLLKLKYLHQRYTNYLRWLKTQ